MNVSEFVDDVMAQLAPFVMPGSNVIFDMPCTVADVDDEGNLGATVALFESSGTHKEAITRITFSAVMPDMGIEFPDMAMPEEHLQ